MGQNNLAVFTSDRINEGFSQENVWPFSRVAKKSGRNNEATVFNTKVAVRRVTRILGDPGAVSQFSSTGGRAPGYRLSPDHFQTVK